MDLLQYREEWEKRPSIEIFNEKMKIEDELTLIKNTYRNKKIERKDFYNQYENLSLHLTQLKKCLKYICLNHE